MMFPFSFYAGILARLAARVDTQPSCGQHSVDAAGKDGAPGGDHRNCYGRWPVASCIDSPHRFADSLSGTRIIARRGVIAPGRKWRDVHLESNDQGVTIMQRLKVTGGTPPPPRPGGNWLAGMVIGSAIMTMATQAMLIGATAAINHVPLKGG
jgi:hypothetical protein